MHIFLPKIVSRDTGILQKHIPAFQIQMTIGKAKWQQQQRRWEHMMTIRTLEFNRQAI